MPYEVKRVKLGAETPEVELTARNRGVSHVFALDNQPAAEFEIRIGDNPYFTVSAPFAFDVCGDETRQGISYRVNADQVVAATEVEVIIVTGGSGPRGAS